MNKKIFLLTFTIFLSLFLIFPIQTSFANTNSAPVIDSKIDKIVLFINQVRGNECCDKGNLNHLKQQFDKISKENLSANFALRYDVLTDQSYLNLINRNLITNKNNFEIGAFLEITPKLAQDANVQYFGDDNNWYKAHVAYTIGYDLEDRKKIIDQYFNTFYKNFGSYPKFITAWIIDTPSVNYIREKYDVKIVQITREQWGVDSYTLHGGYVHYPYFASNNWLFIPKQNWINNLSDNLLVLRQTGSDPLYNYGDTTSAFTTQPNDYARDGKKIEYFYQLSDRLLNQSQNEYSFLLLGLENSMESKYQDEYERQIDYLKNKGIKTFKTTDFYKHFSKMSEKSTGSETNTTFIYSNDVTNKKSDQAVFVQNNNYRARILIKENKLYITDLRIFSEDFDDPYQVKKANNSGYFITPHVFDSARFYDINKEESYSQIIKNKVKEVILPEYQKSNSEAKTVENDTKTNIDGILIADFSNPNISYEGNKLIINDEVNNKTEIEFLNKSIKYNNTLNHKSKIIETGIENFNYKTDLKCNRDFCEIILPQITSQKLTELRQEVYPYYFPELLLRSLDKEKTTVYAHNKYAIFGKNPVRVVVIPRDKNGFQIQTKDNIKVITNEDITYESADPQTNGTIFVDVYSKNAGKKSIKIEMGDLKKELKIYFVHDCANKNDILNCIKKPSHIYWYLINKFYSKIRST